MTTLQAIGFTLAGGSCASVVAMVGFGFAISARHPFIAPRCTARPKDAIYNPYPAHSCQDRGSATFGWISWTLGLTYDTMLRGIPGTGTRERGLAGSMLKVHLDGIVLLRFHAVALKVAALAAVLLLCVILPAYATGQCYKRSEAGEEDKVDGCAAAYNDVTNYERTTIANVPSLSDIADSKESYFVTQNGILGRLYAVNMVMWTITGYFLYCLREEWIQILAMRRVYYLERDIWEERCEELRDTLLHDEIEKRSRQKKAHFTFEETKKKKAEEPHLVDRDPWIPHPEQRDTVPNVALYSVLVGKLPALPEQAVDAMNTGDTVNISKRDSIDWQLSLTAAFFDHCVPNQPGFSSSVAAVSIIPSSKAIALAWKKWYRAAKKLRRLRFIRDQIAQRRHYEIVLDTPDAERGEGNVQSSTRQFSARNFLISPWLSAANVDTGESPPPIYQSQDKNHEYYREVLGSVRDQDAERQAYDAFRFGPEQTAVYSREFAQAAAPCCPNGCMEGSVRRAGIDELIQMEREAAEAVHDANLALLKARRLAVRWEEEEEESNDDDESENIPALQPVQPEVPEGASEEPEALVKPVGFEAVTPAPKISATSPPQTPNKHKNTKHRRNRTLEAVKFPEDMSLEAELYNKHAADLNKSSSQEIFSKGSLISLDSSGSVVKKESKSHRRKRSLDSLELPGSLGLESDIFHKASANSGLHDSNSKVSHGKLSPQNSPSSRGGDPMELIDLDTPTPKMGNSDITNNEGVAVDSREVEDLEAGEAQNWNPDNEWSLVQNIVNDVSRSDRSKKNRKVASGAWKRPSLRIPSLRSIVKKTRKKATKGATKVVGTVVDQAMDTVDLSRESTYAVVTFTSRQAAVAARHCLADGRGVNRWISSPELPIPPLADAAAMDLLACKNCCKPVTLSISDRQKDYRLFCAVALLAGIYIFYTIPLTAASRLVEADSIKELFPNLSEWTDEHWGNGAELISGLLQSSIWTLFFALCPVIFRAISNFGSGATSVANAEFKALQYFWCFMVLAAFSTTLISNMFLNGWNNLGDEFSTVLRDIARTIPSVQAVSWLNWIIFRFTVLLPLNYLLNMPTFVFAAIGFKCCSRIVRGGGPGPPTPYRIYVDSGTVLLCLMALAPASPIIAPACFAYFLIFQPILRRNLIFMYRPKFDGGGFRWPFIFDMCISCIVAGQILLTMQMILKQAGGPSLAASLPIIPTLLFHRSMKRQYLRPFQDAALLQTSLLDGWDTADETSAEKREEFRRFLVDSHKASYVPVCIAGGNTEGEGLTAEPAVVVPLETDVSKDLLDEPLHSPYEEEVINPGGESSERRPTQHGAMLRRNANTLALLRTRASSSDSGVFKSFRKLSVDVLPEPSPFDRRAAMATFNSHSGPQSTSSRRAAFANINENYVKEE